MSIKGSWSRVGRRSAGYRVYGENLDRIIENERQRKGDENVATTAEQTAETPSLHELQNLRTSDIQVR